MKNKTEVMGVLHTPTGSLGSPGDMALTWRMSWVVMGVLHTLQP